ncbi:hypothetical protein F5X68DRAFT_225763 [Plectosphaerella plurivora]|uniref:LysM domain-containing protein n=1 Tax=Plectosphaerella plurivora TaxID=936078 RepID=A0A9P8V173_9PEZI|nr:hypothetical protein F5X68DRAFT_225763 [Plectosphaerella plurivora]
MSRFSRYDTDEERLPEGMERIGYDADTQTYTYRDSTGRTYEGAPGATYGHLSPSGGEDEPFMGEPGQHRPLRGWEEERNSWRQAWAPLLNFFLLVGLFLLGVGWLLYGRSGAPTVECAEGDEAYKVAKGDTCWALAQARGMSVEDILKKNEGLDCDALPVGGLVCLTLKA